MPEKYNSCMNIWCHLKNILFGIKFKKINEDFENRLKILNRQALHAKSLGFIHPTTKKFISFESKLPQDFKKILDLLNKLSH